MCSTRYPEFLRALSLVALELQLPFDQVATRVIGVERPIPGHQAKARSVFNRGEERQRTLAEFESALQGWGAQYVYYVESKAGKGSSHVSRERADRACRSSARQKPRARGSILGD